MIDRDFYDRERVAFEESFRRPVTIQFGAIFELFTGSPKEPLFGLGVVSDVKTGISFYGGALIRLLRRGELGQTTTVSILEGGDHYRTNIIKMTGEILTVDQYLEGVRQGFTRPPDPKDEYWERLKLELEELFAKGSRELAGHHPSPK